jgi:hypothetical protein
MEPSQFRGAGHPKSTGPLLNRWRSFSPKKLLFYSIRGVKPFERALLVPRLAAAVKKLPALSSETVARR